MDERDRDIMERAAKKDNWPQNFRNGWLACYEWIYRKGDALETLATGDPNSLRVGVVDQPRSKLANEQGRVVRIFLGDQGYMDVGMPDALRLATDIGTCLAWERGER